MNQAKSKRCAIKRLGRHLQGALKSPLTNHPTLIGYTDLDWAGDEPDRKSTTEETCSFSWIHPLPDAAGNQSKWPSP